MPGIRKIRERFATKSGIWKRISALSKSDWAVLALVGVLLLVIAMPTGKSGSVSSGNTAGGAAGGEHMSSVNGGTKDSGGAAGSSLEKNDDISKGYAAYLEKKLEAVLSQMEGVGRVKVMVTVSDAGETVVEKDVSAKETVTSESDSAGGSRTVSENNSEEQTIYMESGDVSTPYIQKEKMPSVEGVVVVAEGAGSPVVISNISESVQALLPVEVHRIKVVKMCSKEE